MPPFFLRSSRHACLHSRFKLFLNLFIFSSSPHAEIYQCHENQLFFLISFLDKSIHIQDDAACRVIARLKKERDEAWSLLAQSERQPHKMRIWALLNRKYMLELLRHYC
ncbi:hypothetical protein AB3S75_003101 [Citrus x aurantiifolia]